MARARRWLWRIGIAAGVGVLVWLAVRETPVEVDVVPTVMARLETVVEEEGVTRPLERYLVATPIAGTLERIALEEGAVVKAGEVLARIAPAAQDPRALEMAEADLAAAESRRAAAEVMAAEALARAEQATREADRRRGLMDMGAISREAFERTLLSAEVAGREAAAAASTLEAATADVRAAAARASMGPGGRIAPLELRAPSRGTVLRVIEESERAVAPGTPLLELADVSGLELVIDVRSEDAVNIRPGHRIRVTAWGGDGHLEGTVRQVQPNAFTKVSSLGVEEQRVDVLGDLQSTPATLGSGYRFVAQIVTWEGEVLSVPSSALFRLGERWGVFVVEGGRARLREVDVGRRGVERSEVTSGLEEGTEVVRFPSDLVGEGTRVIPRRTG